MDYFVLLKVELYLYLDCLVSYLVVCQLKFGLFEQVFEEEFIVLFKCKDLVDFLKWVVKGFELLQFCKVLCLVMLDLLGILQVEKVIYVEIWFVLFLYVM